MMIDTAVLRYMLIAILFLSGCQPKAAPVHPGPEGAGSVVLYLQPFPQEAQRLLFGLAGIAAVDTAGREIPLSLSLREFTQGSVGRQRLVASGSVPPGDYRGLAFTVNKASLTSEEGASALLVPEDPVIMEFPFRVNRDKAVALFLVFKYRESVRGGFRFSPVFSAFLPGKPVTELAGYVSNSGSHTVTVFDKIAGRAVAVLAVGSEPRGVAIDPLGKRAFVSLAGEDAIAVVDMEAWDTVAKIRLHAGDSPHDLALVLADVKSSSGSELFERLLLTVNGGSNTVSIVDPVAFTELDRIAVGKEPQSILLDRSGQRAYVFNALSNSISVVDVAGRRVIATVPTETRPFRGAFNREGDRLYVIYQASPYLIMLDPFTFAELKRVFVGSRASALKVDTNTDMLYVARKQSSDIAVYDPFSFIPVDSIEANSEVVYMTIDDEANNLFLLSSETGTLTAVNLSSNQAVSVIDVGKDPYWAALMGER